MNVKKIRTDFPSLKRRVNEKKLIYFDNAATSLKPKQVIDGEKCYYEKNCANINRGLHEMSEEATIAFENSRRKIAKFVNAKQNEIIFTKNTTESINLIANSLMNTGIIKKNDKIVLSEMEHHSNIVPWQYIARKTGAKLDFVKIKENFEIDYYDLEKKTKNAKIISICGASNTIATMPNLKKIEKVVHENNSIFCIDAAQLIAHKKIDLKKLNADFIAFSAHKMLGPTGIGCLIGKEKLLDKMEPFLFGGDMVESVTLQKSVFEKSPKKFEAGTPNIAGAYSFNSAINYFEKIGYEKIQKQEWKLKNHCLEGLKKMGNLGVRIYTNEKENSAPIIMFDCKINCHDLAIILNDYGIAIRSGMHCAEPIIKKYNKNGLARVSFSFYNTIEEVDYFLKKLEFVLKQINKN
jgi:cysteine desulfurase / selenocysteine lyase